MRTKKEAFTPGPWHYQEKADEYTHIIRAEDDMFICSCPQNSLKKSKANARLISVVPELLGAAKKAVIALQAANRITGKGSAEVAALCAAILKATGEGE